MMEPQASPVSPDQTPNPSAHTIVFGNEKGGTGKSTLAMHVVVCLLDQGRRVGVIDLDSRQRSISRFLENRRAYLDRTGLALVEPVSVTVQRSEAHDTRAGRREEQQALQAALDRLRGHVDLVVIDCPGSHTYLSQLAHALADTLVTPMNDSFIDLDLLGQVNPDNWQVERLSHYAEMVWESRKFRSASELPPMDWVVTRNRLATLDSINNRRVDSALEALQKRIMFRYVPGLSERVTYKELFPKGLTMMDLGNVPESGKLTLPQVAARNEVRNLVAALNLPER
ncbi:MAG: division plane positioning ATPase MipZ [Xanthomonadales bacterium]|nr:division plane positioning ATPase MipZ [Xanthomonadales bacterium]